MKEKLEITTMAVLLIMGVAVFFKTLPYGLTRIFTGLNPFRNRMQINGIFERLNELETQRFANDQEIKDLYKKIKKLKGKKKK